MYALVYYCTPAKAGKECQNCRTGRVHQPGPASTNKPASSTDLGGGSSFGKHHACHSGRWLS